MYLNLFQGKGGGWEGWGGCSRGARGEQFARAGKKRRGNGVRDRQTPRLLIYNYGGRFHNGVGEKEKILFWLGSSP